MAVQQDGGYSSAIFTVTQTARFMETSVGLISIVSALVGAIFTSRTVGSEQTCIHLGLTHLPLVPHIYVNEMGQHWFR